MDNTEAQGCFGSVLSYDPSDKVCAEECSHTEECAEKAYDALVDMRNEVDVSKLEKKFERDRIKRGKTINRESKPPGKKPSNNSPKRKELTDEQQAVVDDGSLPKKPRRVILSLFRKGIDGEFILAALKSGKNPFEHDKPKTLNIACSMLLKGGFLKSELHKAFMEQPMTKRTAHSQVSIVVAVLKILNVIYEENGTERIKFKES